MKTPRREPPRTRTGESDQQFSERIVNCTRMPRNVRAMIYALEHGQVAFTVPLFDEFMRREMELP